MQVPRVFRVSRGFAVISALRGIPDVRAPRVTSAHRARRETQDQWARQVHREISALKGPEGFRARPDLPDLWGRRV